MLIQDFEVDGGNVSVDREEEGGGVEGADKDYDNDGENEINNYGNSLETCSLLSLSSPPPLVAMADVITKEEEGAEAETEAGKEEEKDM